MLNRKSRKLTYKTLLYVTWSAVAILAFLFYIPTTFAYSYENSDATYLIESELVLSAAKEVLAGAPSHI